MELPAQPTPQQARDPAFWQQAAYRMKHAADAAWSGYRAMDRLVAHEQGPFFRPEGDGRTPTEYLELAKLHAYLLALSIQLIALAVLVSRDSKLFAQDPLSRSIVALVQACGVDLTDSQRRILHGIESSLGWRRQRYQSFHVTDPEALAGLERMRDLPGSLGADDKELLDRLFATLDEALDASAS